MRKLGLALACLVATLALAGSAAGNVVIGVNDDAGKYEIGPSWFYPSLSATGMTVNTITLRWDDYQPYSVRPAEQEVIEQAIARAQANGITVALDLYPIRSQVFTGGGRCTPSTNPEACGNTQRIAEFASWAATVARMFPSVRDFVVMNECNQPLFLNPQWNTAGENQSAAICGRALAAVYDALKGVSRANFVWGIGLSPRGNDKPEAVSNSSTTPVTFLDALGKWYRAFVQKTGRTAPLMDGFDYHPYPVPQSLPFEQGYADAKSASVSNLSRIYQAFYLAFNGTPQRTIGQHAGGGLPVSLNETGVQTDSTGFVGYTGDEVSAGSGGVFGQFATEEFQSAWYVQMLDVVACDPNVRIVNIFHLIDEFDLAGWQSGLFFANQVPKKSAAAVKSWIVKTGGRCQGKVTTWTPALIEKAAPPDAEAKVAAAKKAAVKKATAQKAAAKKAAAKKAAAKKVAAKKAAAKKAAAKAKARAKARSAAQKKAAAQQA
jgi:hypothetical protein